MHGCVLWGNCVIIHNRGRPKVLQQLHDGHPGVTLMESIARSLTWWPGIDNDIEQTVRNCQQNQKSPTPAPLHSLEWPSHPWTRLHIDHIRPFLGKYFLVVVDAHSKWIEIMVVPSTSAQHTIRQLLLASIPQSLCNNSNIQTMDIIIDCDRAKALAQLLHTTRLVT